MPSLPLSSNQKVKIDRLRDQGKQCLALRQYTEAIQFYSAILQIVEGLPGEDSFELRRRCGLTLAECEIRAGNYHQAVARCSEVIEECVNFADSLPKKTKRKKAKKVTMDSIDLDKTLNRAHYRRGLSLKKLNELRIALIDMKKAAEYHPDDKQTLKELAFLKAKVGTMTSAHVEEEESKLQDFVEDCQVQYPRQRYTRKQLEKMFSSMRSSSTSSSPSSSFSLSPSSQSLSPFGDFSKGLEGFGDFGSMLGGSPPDLSQMLRGLGGNDGGSGMIEFALQNLLGWDAQTVKRVTSIFNLCQSIYKKFNLVYTKVIQYRDIVLLIATVAWAIYAFRGSPLFHEK
eukprot:gene682-738_t